MRIAIGLPAYGGKVVSHQGMTWIRLGSQLGLHPKCQVISFMTVDICGVDRARNYLLQQAREAKADWLLSIDSDVWIDRGDLFQMIEDGEKMEAAVIGPPVMMRGAVQKPMVYRFVNKIRPCVSDVCKRAEGHSGECIYDQEKAVVADGLDQNRQRTVEGHLVDVEHRKVSEVDAIGGSCLAINLHRIGQSQFCFTPTISEDLEFCRQVKEIDGKILVDGRIRTCHMDRTSSILVWEK